MNSHDELGYIKIMTRILDEMSKENDKIRRELLMHRMIILLEFVLILFLVYKVFKGVN